MLMKLTAGGEKNLSTKAAQTHQTAACILKILKAFVNESNWL
jgi:hypothetical protein